MSWGTQCTPTPCDQENKCSEESREGKACSGLSWAERMEWSRSKEMYHMVQNVLGHMGTRSFWEWVIIREVLPSKFCLLSAEFGFRSFLVLIICCLLMSSTSLFPIYSRLPIFLRPQGYPEAFPVGDMGSRSLSSRFQWFFSPHPVLFRFSRWKL